MEFPKPAQTGWHGLQNPKCHRRRWSGFFRKPGLRGGKPARWWPTRLPTYSPDPQEVKKCWVGHVPSTFGGSEGQKPKFWKPTPTAKKSWKIEKISKNRFFFKGPKWLLEVPYGPQSGCGHPWGPLEVILDIFEKIDSSKFFNSFFFFRFLAESFFENGFFPNVLRKSKFLFWSESFCLLFHFTYFF